MNFSNLNRRIKIEQKSVTRDSYGAEVIAWTTLATVWGSALDDLGSKSGMESNKQGIRVLEKLTRIVIRYRADITSDMRVTIMDRSRVMQIASIAEVGRRDATELMGMEWTT
jgi:SPP1 family predicted phage head-tail adaptor